MHTPDPLRTSPRSAPSWLAESFRIVYLVFLKPVTFRRLLKPDEASAWQGRVRPTLTWTLRALPATVLLLLVLYIAVGLTVTISGENFRWTRSLSYVAVVVAVGVTVGVAWGVAVGVARGVARGVALSVAGVAVLFAGILAYWTGVLVLGFAEDVAMNVFIGVVLGLAWVVAWGMANGVAWGVVMSIIGGVFGGIGGGVAGGIAMGVASLVAYFRLIPYLLTLPLMTLGYIQARGEPGWNRALASYRLATALLDEFTLLPVPFLDRFLVLIAEADREAGLREITYIARDTRQGWAAQATLIELARRDMLRLETLRAIAQAERDLAWLRADRKELPADVSEALQRLAVVSREVAAALAPASRREREAHFEEAHKGLEDLQRFAAFSRRTQGFIEVAEAWRKVLERQATLLRELPNPFVAGPPLVAGSRLFVGREDILRQIERYLAVGRGTAAEAMPKMALVLYGQRRMGKSSILLQLPVRLPEEYIPAYADLRGLAAQGTAGLLRGLAGVVAEAVAARGLLPPPVAPLESFAPEPFAAFNAFLDQTEASIGTRRVALLLDEFEWLQEKVDEGPISRDIFGYLASAIKLRPRLFLVFAGLHSLEQMRREYWTAFLYGNSVAISISYLESAEAEQILDKAPVEMEPAVRRRILKATGCQPYLLQEVCYDLLERLNAQTPPSERPTRADVETTLRAIMDTGKADYYFEDYVWRHSNQSERQALVALAQGQQEGLDPQALESLRQREILKQEKGGWRYQVELVKRWMARKASQLLALEPA